MSFEATALLLAWGAIVLLAFAMAGLLRQIKILTTMIAGWAPDTGGPTPGQIVPPELLSHAGKNGAQNGSLLVFMERDCPGCVAITPELARLGRGDHLPISLIFREAAKPMSDANLRVMEGMSAAFDHLQIPATPFAVRVNDDGEVSDAGAIGSPEALRRFIQASTKEKQGVRRDET